MEHIDFKSILYKENMGFPQPFPQLWITKKTVNIQLVALLNRCHKMSPKNP